MATPRTDSAAVLHGAQDLADLALHIGARGAEDEVDRDLREAKLGEVVVKRGAGTVLHDAAQGIHLHVFAGLGMFAAHQRQLAVHHLDQRIGRVGQAQRGHALNVGGQDDIIMRDPGQGKGPHRPLLRGSQRWRGAQRDGGQQAQHAFALLDHDGALRDALKAEQADLAKAGVEVGQDVDGLRHLGERIAARVKGIAGEGHGKLRRMRGEWQAHDEREIADQAVSRGMMPSAASWPCLGGDLRCVIDGGIKDERCLRDDGGPRTNQSCRIGGRWHQTA